MSDEYIECNSPWERVPTCACDPGYGKPPSKLQRLECKMRRGPCAERGVVETVDTAGLNPAINPETIEWPGYSQTPALALCIAALKARLPGA